MRPCTAIEPYCVTALPSWPDGLGVAIAVALLQVITVSNLAHALTPAHGAARPLGPMAALLCRIAGRELHPALRIAPPVPLSMAVVATERR